MKNFDCKKCPVRSFCISVKRNMLARYEKEDRKFILRCLRHYCPLKIVVRDNLLKEIDRLLLLAGMKKAEEV